MSGFGDYDPDDAWDAGDTVVEQIRVLINRIIWIVDHRDDLGPRIERIVADLAGISQRVADRDRLD